MKAEVLYDLRLRLSHQYAGHADGARHLVHVIPMDIKGRQSVQRVSLKSDPQADEQSDRRDYFGNLITQLTHRSPHGAMQIEMRARVRCFGGDAVVDKSPKVRDLAEMIARHRMLDPEAPHHFLGPSARIPLPGEVAAYAHALSSPDASAFATMLDLGQALHRDMRFDNLATTVDTSLEEAFAHRHGVCQDFAQIMIAGLRILGIPARYVSGYLRTEPPKGHTRLEGADAMHAWISAWCGPSMGWVEFDPTNNAVVRIDHIVVSYGRDYADVAPIKGVLRASGPSNVGQAVDVIPVFD